MFEDLAHFVSRLTSRESSPNARILWQIAGGILFLIIIPVILILAARFLTRRIRAGRNMLARMFAGVPGVLLGPGIMAWTIYTFFTEGKGTAVPLAAPQRLVTGGPFKYVRNPIQLGIMLYYFGIGCMVESVSAGLAMLLMVAIPGTLYHHLIEEKELMMRFGRRYGAYRRETPFILPCIWGK